LLHITSTVRTVAMFLINLETTFKAGYISTSELLGSLTLTVVRYSKNYRKLDKVQKKTVILSVSHHHQNLIESACKHVYVLYVFQFSHSKFQWFICYRYETDSLITDITQPSICCSFTHESKVSVVIHNFSILYYVLQSHNVVHPSCSIADCGELKGLV
jgi:hypothetical protein